MAGRSDTLTFEASTRPPQPRRPWRGDVSAVQLATSRLRGLTRSPTTASWVSILRRVDDLTDSLLYGPRTPAGGAVLEQVLKDAPQLAPQVDRTRQARLDLRILADDVRADISRHYMVMRYSSTEDEETSRIKVRVHSLLDAASQYEVRLNDLLHEAYRVDLGGTG